jgi:hypothetical protein
MAIFALGDDIKQSPAHMQLIYDHTSAMEPVEHLGRGITVYRAIVPPFTKNDWILFKFNRIEGKEGIALITSNPYMRTKERITK